MSSRIAAETERDNTPANIKKLSLGWIMAFLFLVSFVGLFSIVPLRKVRAHTILITIIIIINEIWIIFLQVMILKYKLTYPSGTATAFLVNSFHTPKGAKLAKSVS